MRRSCASAATGTTCSATGYICPKGSTLKQLHEDPDRLRRPARARGTARHVEVVLGRGLRGGRAAPAAPCSSAHGRDAVAVYLGNPNAHTLAGQLYARPLLRALGHDEHLLGLHRRPAPEGDVVRDDVRRPGLIVPVPDIDRTDHLLMLGRQPVRVERQPRHRAGLARPPRGLGERGGTLVVVDPRRSRTAERPTSGCRSGPAATPTC